MSTTAKSSGLLPEDITAITSIWPKAAQSLIEQDFDAFLGLYTDDPIVMPPNNPALHGKEAIKQWMAAFPKISEARFEGDEIAGAGGFAFVRGRYSFTLHIQGAPGPIEDHGKFIEIRKRQADGSWPIFREMFNSDLAS